MNKYRLKSVEVEATRWIPGELVQPKPHKADTQGVVWEYDADGCVDGGIISTRTRDIVIHLGDWIIRDKAKNLVFVRTDEKFREYYERVK